MPSRVVDLFACSKALGGRSQLDAIWKMILSYLIGCLWREKKRLEL
jgi:hypothetical protein